MNNGNFGIALDFVGGKMLSAYCGLLSIDGNLASVTECPTREDFDVLFLKNTSFHSIGAHAYSFADNHNYQAIYRNILNYLSLLFDNNELPKPPINVLGSLSVETVKRAHELLEKGSRSGEINYDMLKMATANLALLSFFKIKLICFKVIKLRLFICRAYMKFGGKLSAEFK